MQADMMPLVERLVVAMESMSYEVKNISHYMQGMTGSLHDLNVNVSSLLKEKRQADASTLPSEVSTDLLSSTLAAGEPAYVDIVRSHQYKEKDIYLVPQTYALDNENSSGSTEIMSFIGSVEDHIARVDTCDKSCSFGSARQIMEGVNTEASDEENSQSVNASPKNIINLKDGNFAEASSLSETVANPIVTYSHVESTVGSDDQMENSNSNASVKCSSGKALRRDVTLNLNNCKGKGTVMMQRAIIAAHICRSERLKQGDNGRELEESGEESGDIEHYVKEDLTVSQEEEGAGKNDTRKRSKPSTSSGQHSKQLRQKRTFSCSICGKCFNFSSNLKNHQRVHTGGKPFECDLCKKTFTHKCTLSTHMRVHSSEKPFICSICKKAFKRKVYLKTHMRIHNGEKPYQCGKCKKAFGQQCTLLRHMRTHTGERPFKCQECGKAFAQSNDLVRHKLCHSSQQRYACNDCEKCFTLLGNLSRHRRKEHEASALL